MNKSEILEKLIEDVDSQLSDEEILHIILDKQFSKNINEKSDTFGQVAADFLAKFAGSWTFIIVFIAILAGWIIVNNMLNNTAFDPYPFILMNLILSCTAAIQAPLIMMSQNRQEEKDRRRAENDYAVNLKTEIIIQDLHRKMDYIIELLGENKEKEQ